MPPSTVFASLVSSGRPMAFLLRSAQAVTLSRGVLRDMLLRKLKTVAAAVLAVAVVAGAGRLAYHGLC